MLEADNAQMAAEAFAEFEEQSHVQHFHDPERRIGSAVAQMFGASDKTAWDSYLMYPKGIEWKEEAPRPAAWFHQLQEEPWASRENLRWGDALGPAIQRGLAEVLGLRAA